MKKLLVSMMVILLCAGCTKDNDEIDSANLKIDVSIDTEQTVYPSLLLGLGLMTSQSEEEFDVFDITFEKSVKGNVKIVFEATKLNHETIITQNGCKAGETISPRIKWNYEELASAKTPGLVDFTVICYVNNIECDRHNIRANYRSVNECVYLAVDAQTEEYLDFTWMFGAYVNENHPKIDPFLQKLLSNGIVSRFIGYQGDDDDVLDQVFSVWYELQTRGVTYSNVVLTSNPSQGICSQYVRFFDEVLDNTQANCVDGTVFFSSILRKIGIEPILILIPGHMYLGFYDTSREDYYLLETTMVGSMKLNEITASNASQILRQYINEWITQQEYNDFTQGKLSLNTIKFRLSARTFNEAIECNLEDHGKIASKFGNELMYAIWPIMDVRQIVQPIESMTTRSATTYSSQSIKDLGKVRGKAKKPEAIKGVRPIKASR